jgi:hypothetical protein
MKGKRKERKKGRGKEKSKEERNTKNSSNTFEIILGKTATFIDEDFDLLVQNMNKICRIKFL